MKHAKDSMWKFVVAETNADAWPSIEAENPYNEPPTEGSAYVTVPVHIVVEDSETEKDGFDPSASFEFSYVTASGNSYGLSTCSVLLPAPGQVYELGKMYAGAEADFLACAAVPVADIPGGIWRISSMVSSNSNAFFVGA